MQSVASPLGQPTTRRILRVSRGLTQDPLRADDGIRTRDPHLGKVMLYQLSHVRIAPTEALLRCNARKNLAGVVASCKSASQRSVTEAGVVACANHPLCLSLAGAIGAAVARFVHTEEVTGSNPVSPTLVTFSPSHPRRVSSFPSTSSIVLPPASLGNQAMCDVSSSIDASDQM